MISISRIPTAFEAILAAAFFLVSPQIAYAATDCSDQKGKVIFEDAFADDTGGWPPGNDHAVITYGKPALSVRLEDPLSGFASLNVTFNPKDGDYCLQFVVPKSPAEDNNAVITLRFWDSADTGYIISVNAKGDVWLSKWVINAYVSILSNNDSSIKPGVVVTLRALVRDGLLTTWVNGKEFKKVKTQTPDGTVKFGFSVGMSKPVPPPGWTFEINELRVTAGQ